MTNVPSDADGAPDLPNLCDLAVRATVLDGAASTQEALDSFSDPAVGGAVLVALADGVAVLSERLLLDYMRSSSDGSGAAHLDQIEGLVRIETLAGGLSIADAALFAVSRPAQARLDQVVVVSGDGVYATVSIDRLLMALANHHKRAARQLRMSQTKLSAVVAGAPFVLWATDADGLFTVSEGRGLQELGLEPDQVIGGSIYDLYGDEPAIMDPFERALTGKTARGVVEVGEAAFETLYLPLWLHEGRPTGVIGVSVSISERLRAQRELEASERRATQIIETANDAYVEIDEPGAVIAWNRAAERIFGCPAEEAMGKPIFDTFLPREIAAEHSEDLGLYLSTGVSEFVGSRFESVARRLDGTLLPVEVTVWELVGPWGRRFSALITDISERKRAEDLLRRSEERFRSLVQNSADAVLVLDRDLSITYLSPSGERITRQTDVEGISLLDLVHGEDRASLAEDLARVASQAQSSMSFQARIEGRDGSWRSIEATATNLLDDPNVEGIVLNCRDVSDRVRLEEELRRRAFSDQTTGLLNRVALEERILATMLQVEGAHAPVALLVLDVAGFKDILEALGRSAGDQVLRVVAARLQAATRPSDAVARLEGDQFAVLLDSPAGVDRADKMASRILSSFDRPISVEGHTVSISLVCGAAVAEGAGEPADLMRNADIAMQQAKSSRCVEFYVDSMGHHVSDALSLRTDLACALERDELTLHYQPIVEIATSGIVGFEALLRWNHPVRGSVPPSDFIPVAESEGSILEIGRWVLHEACRRAAGLRSLSGTPLVIAVNLSARQFESTDLVVDVESALKDSGLDPSDLTLEITESLSMRDTAGSVTQLDRFRALGVRIALDDFGTGYSSLAYLPRFPLDVLKIDRRFVQGVFDHDTRSVVRAIVSLARSLGLKTVAEGVEQASQLAALQELGCDMAQGFLLHRPLSLKAARELVRTGA